MDVPLYAVALAVFAVLYLAIGVFLAYSLIITLLVVFAYLVVRYRELPQNYPYSARDAMTTLIFIGITWSIFIFVSDKNPVPFIGSGFTYTNSSLVPFDAIIAIAFVVSITFLLVFAFMVGRGQGEEMAVPERAANEPK
jgi:phosphatidylglycerophosphate synthase